MNRFITHLMLFAVLVASCPVNAQDAQFPDYDTLIDSMTVRMLRFQQTYKCTTINEVRKALLSDMQTADNLNIKHLPAMRKKVVSGRKINVLCRKGSLLFCGMRINRQTQAPEAYPIASATVLGSDGLCATNYHVLSDVILSGMLGYQPPTDMMRFGIDCDGNVYPVTQILYADPVNDFSLFKVDTRGGTLTPIPLGSTAIEGDDVYCLAHARGIPFYLTHGMVSRNTTVTNKKNGHQRMEMQMTADYAVGSSGGPIVDNCGNCVGIVGSTYSLYANQSEQRDFQMSIKKAVPVKLIKACFKSK